jgi:hypothetical protein
MNLKYKGSTFDTSFKNKIEYNKDRATDFNSLVKLLNTSDTNHTKDQESAVSSFQAEVKQAGSKYSGDKVKAIQAWSAER